MPFDTSVSQGGFGARWSAELRVRNSTGVPINLFPETCSGLGRTFPCERRIDIPAGRTVMLSVLPDSSTHGVLLYVPIDHRADIHFSLSVRDLTSGDTAGTAIPVVRASQYTTSATIIGVPISADQRRSLRVYDPFLPINAVFLVRVIDEATEGIVFERQYSMFLPTDPPSPILVPATFDFSDALAAPRVLAATRVTVTIERIFPGGLGFWPMISVTSNRDNHLAVFTPN
ncbi:MAG TPA: hypothetical protein VHX14_16020 [Thermoanaerobaculia bacterium]|nr:hypothetical protein [Thermoanaerobaculia bacterium]